MFCEKGAGGMHLQELVIEVKQHSQLRLNCEENYCLFYIFNSLPNNKILKAFADDKINVSQIMISVFDRVENIVVMEKMLVTSIFTFSHNIFKKLLSWGLLKVGILFYRVNSLQNRSNS